MALLLVALLKSHSYKIVVFLDSQVATTSVVVGGGECGGYAALACDSHT
eukprot:CAMPEP_0185774224 /NCGR_PEP_ID=MMETSP1174-20130828/77252_1 /TAXON_ID=35687 /ORGANISM="Dictyocha speculum, Strain CCMP1381" /LENGTH=48 /DNA_ID= /DNA_START= /DNA_END= /DNA_ORIENTATION=